MISHFSPRRGGWDTGLFSFSYLPMAWDDKLKTSVLLLPIFLESVYRWQVMRQQARDQRTPVVKQKRCAERVLSRHLAAVPLPETKATNSTAADYFVIIRRFIQTWLDQAHLLWMDRDPSADTKFVCFSNYLSLSLSLPLLAPDRRHGALFELSVSFICRD